MSGLKHGAKSGEGWWTKMNDEDSVFLCGVHVEQLLNGQFESAWLRGASKQSSKWADGGTQCNSGAGAGTGQSTL